MDEQRAISAEKEIALIGNAMVSKEPTREGLDRLYAFCKDQSLPLAVRQCAIFSILKVMVNVLPDYTVGRHSVKDNVSRDVRDRRGNEKLLLDYSRKFVQYCELMAFGKNNNIRIRIACARALSELFAEKRRYNTGESLSKTVVRLACLNVECLRAHACKSIKRVFESDTNGDFTLKIMSRIAETATPKISAELLMALNSIQLKPISGKIEKPKLEDKELERDLKDVGIIDRAEEQRHNQAAVLEHLFGTVFRFLKETKSEEHFCVAMNVVKNFVMHINIDVVPPIIDALKQRRFSLRASIIAANTALSVCDAAKLVVDLRTFYASVYARAYEALEERDVLLEFLTLFDLIMKQIDTNRTAAFAKRMMMMALQSTADAQGVILAYIRQMMCNNVAMTRAVDFEFEGAGEFNVTLDDPDSCNGPCAKFWELSHLANSHNKFVADIAKEVSKLTSLEEVRNAEIKAANEKRDWSAMTIMSTIDYSSRIFDVALMTMPARPLPKTFKVFEFQ